MAKSLIIYLLVIALSVIQAQTRPSIHQIEAEKYKSLKLNKSVVNEDTEDIIPLNKIVEKNLSHSVFGYYPDWEYLDNAHNNFNYELLTHIAAFDFAVSSTGQISDPAGWPWTSVINDAHSNGVKMIMVVVNFNPDDIHKILTTSFTRWAFMLGVQNKIKTYKLDGVNVDFEALNVSDRGDLLNGFLQELSDSVHSVSSDLEVSFAAPAVNWGGWDLTGLANSCDYLFVMGYDFYGSWSTTTGPTAPLSSNSPYNISNTINVEYGTVSSFYPEKLILGVPYYGPHWTATSSNEGAGTVKFLNAERFRNAQVESETYGVKWSTTFQNSWYSYLSNSEYHQVWFDNAASLGLKFDLAISKKLKGVGMWALGYDGTRNELWDLISEKFTIPVSVEKDDKIPTSFVLKQNYPNPFNPVTTIKYVIPSSSVISNPPEGDKSLSSKISPSVQNDNLNVSLIVYDILGKKVATLVNEIKHAGTYSITFNAAHLPSGVYYYILKHGKNLESKKMLLIK